MRMLLIVLLLVFSLQAEVLLITYCERVSGGSSNVILFKARASGDNTLITMRGEIPLRLHSVTNHDGKVQVYHLYNERGHSVDLSHDYTKIVREVIRNAELTKTHYKCRIIFE